MVLNPTGAGTTTIPITSAVSTYPTFGYPEKITVPVKDSNGDYIPSTLFANGGGDNIWKTVFINTKEIVIPSHYSSFQFGGYSSDKIKKLTYEGISATTTFATQITSLEELNYPNVRLFGTGTEFYWRRNVAETTHLKFNVPHAKSATYFGIDGCRADKVIDITGSNFHDMEMLGHPSSWEMGLAFAKGTVVFPSLKTLECIGHTFATEGLHVKMPSILTNSVACFKDDNGGIEHLYFGPNLASMNGNTASRIIARPTKLFVHIPAGNTTTKATLDALGVPYTQDYDYTEDLP